MKEPNADRDIEWVRRALQTAAPPDAANAGRADEVARRGRQARARNGIASAAAVGLAAAAVIIGPHFIDSSPVTNSASGPSPTGVTTMSPTGADDNPYADPCPADPVTVSGPPARNILLPPDVVVVRLCRAQGSGVSSAWQPPQDALVQEVHGFIGWVAQLPKAPVDPCPAARVAPRPFALQFTDTSGHTQTFSSMMTTCGTVTVNFHRVASDRLLGLFRQSLERQRETYPQRPPVTTLSCGRGTPPILPSWMSDVTVKTSFIAAAVCVTDRFEPHRFTAWSHVMRLFNREWTAGARDLRQVAPLRIDRCPLAYVVPPPTYLMTGTGDVVPMRMAGCGDYRIGHFQFLPSRTLLSVMSLP